MTKLILSMALLAPSIGFSAVQCLEGNPKSTNLIDQLTKAKTQSPITKMIYQKYFPPKPTEGQYCADCNDGESSHQKSLKDVSAHVNPKRSHPITFKTVFKPECLAVSGSFGADTTEVSCPDGSKSRGKNLCLTEEQTSYQNAVITQFLSCMQKSGFKTLDAPTLFKMYSLESSFKPSYAYPGGVGLGQVTSIFVEDIHQKHRGQKFLRAIAQSKDSECDAAKIIASEDMKSKPSFKNACNFASVGEGLERNILYSMVGLANSWEKDIKPRISKYSEKYKDHPQIEEAQHLALLNSYGPGGRAAARAAIRRLSGLTPDKFIARLKKPMKTTSGRNLSVYINKLTLREKSIVGKLPEPIKSEYLAKGAVACTNTH